MERKKRTEENRERGREKKVWEEKDFALNYSGLYRLSFKVFPLQFFLLHFSPPPPPRLFLLPSSAGSKENRNTIRYRKEQKNPFPHKTFSENLTWQVETQEEEGQQRGPPAQEKPHPVAEQNLSTHVGHHFRAHF